MKQTVLWFLWVENSWLERNLVSSTIYIKRIVLYDHKKILDPYHFWNPLSKVIKSDLLPYYYVLVSRSLLIPDTKRKLNTRIHVWWPHVGCTSVIQSQVSEVWFSSASLLRTCWVNRGPFRFHLEDVGRDF